MPIENSWLTALDGVGIITNMNTGPMIDERHVISENSFAELVVQHLPEPVAGSPHTFKYRLAFMVNGQCVVRYDNERGEGDHKHVRGVEIPYAFTTPRVLLTDFWNDVDNWRS
jgi:hypothetical protein